MSNYIKVRILFLFKYISSVLLDNYSMSKFANFKFAKLLRHTGKETMFDTDEKSFDTE